MNSVVSQPATPKEVKPLVQNTRGQSLEVRQRKKIKKNRRLQERIVSISMLSTNTTQTQSSSL